MIVAAPVSKERYVSEINDLADEVVIAEQPSEFYAVGQVYEVFIISPITKQLNFWKILSEVTRTKK